MKRRLHGFTLVELLVVIAIIGMLVGLLLPAVQMAREAGRRSVCENNLHQLSGACAAHVQALGFYPSGGWGSHWVGDPDYGTGANQPGGWIYQLLPYLDMATLHDLGKGGAVAASSGTASTTRVTTTIPLLYCPTRRFTQAYPITSVYIDGTLNANITKAPRTDYAINGGSVLPTTLNFAGPPAGTLVSSASLSWPSLANFNGIAAIRSQVTDAMITDNKDTTYLIGEKYMSPDNYTTGKDPGDLYCAISGDDVSLTRWGGDTTMLPSMDRAANNNPPAPEIAPLIFGSSHGAGWHAAFCDGHVQMIAWGFWSPDPNPQPPYTTSATGPTMHTYMATRNKHEVVDVTKIPK